MAWSPVSVKRAASSAGAVLLIAVGATAFACANLATLSLSTSEGTSGATVIVTGASFAYPQSTAEVSPTPVVIHWRTEAGPVLAQTVPDRFGAISTSFTVPDASPGEYVVVATQESARRRPDAPPDAPPVLVAETGTPAATRFQVLPGPTLRAGSPAPAVDALGRSSGELDSSIWIALIATLGAVALLLLGSGLVAFLYQSRQSKLPAEARWVPPGW